MSTLDLPHPPWREQPQLLRRGFVDPSLILDELSARYRPIFGLSAGPFRLAVVGHPAALGGVTGSACRGSSLSTLGRRTWVAGLRSTWPCCSQYR